MKGKCDLIILDLDLPETKREFDNKNTNRDTGIKFLRELKDKDKYYRIPVIMLSAKVTATHFQQAIDADVFDFIDKTGEFTVMIALVKNKKPILGVIGWPTEKTLFVAQKGKGSFRYSNGEWSEITVTTISELPKCRTVGSRHHLSDKEKKFIKKIGIEDFTSVGSSLKVGKISSGEAEAYITTTNKMKEWDTAASYCIISEAGGKMTDMLGNELTYNNKNVYHQNGILVTNGLIHDKIVEEFKKLE